MDSFYCGTTEGRITLTLPVDVSTISAVEIQYRKPDWSLGVFPASYTTGYDCWYDILSDTDIGVNDYGLWTIWAKITFPDGDFTYTTPITFRAVRKGYGGC